LPTVTVYHVEISRNEQGARRVKVFGVAEAADGETIAAGNIGLKTIEHGNLEEPQRERRRRHREPREL